MKRWIVTHGYMRFSGKVRERLPYSQTDGKSPRQQSGKERACQSDDVKCHGAFVLWQKR